jgi:hypothetical protein
MTNESFRHELVQLAFSYGGSVRLRNSLQLAQHGGLLDALTIQQVLNDDAEVFAALRRVPGLGAKCLVELKQLAIRADQANTRCTATSSEGENKQITSYAPEELTASLLIEPAILSVFDILEDLDVNAKTIIRLRLGLDGGEPKTLASIGEERGVSRERIRQIEAKALQRLKRIFHQTLVQMLLARQASALASLAVHQVIRYRDETHLFRSLDLETRLLVTVTFSSVQAWLDATCKRVQNGWLLPSISIEAYELAQCWIAEQLKPLKLPCLFSASKISGAPAEESIKAVLDLTKDIILSGDYLLPARSTRRARRAVRSHELMLRQGYTSLNINELRDAYCREYQDDPCSTRDLQIVLSDNPHLFLNQYEMGWFAIGVISSGTSSRQSSMLSQEGVLEETIDEEGEASEPDTETLHGVLAKILLEHGPQSFNDLRRHFIGLVGSRYSIASVGPVLISNDEFVRIGPGIYAHRRQLQDHSLLRISSGRLLLNKAQLEIFCRALWAGESPQSYVLWTHDMQVHWADWALQFDQKQLLSSLLAVCDIEGWPIKGGDRTRWERLRDHMSVYLLEEDPQPLTSRIPTFREFLSASILAANAGRLSWMSINRATGYRVDDRHSVSSLALMIAAGIVEPAMHWQQQHRATDCALSVLNSFFCNAGGDALTCWPRTVVRSFRQHYGSLLEPGWTSDEMMEPLFDMLSQSSICKELPEFGDTQQLDEYQQLKRQLKDDLSLDRLRERIESRDMPTRQRR